MKKFLLIFALCAPVWAQTPAPDRRLAPPSQAPRALVIPEIAKSKLSNGLDVWVVERHEVPVVQVDLVLPAGAQEDPTDSYGLASFTASLMTEGAGGKSSLELADELDVLGADLTSSSDYDSASVELHVPVARLQPALDLMTLVVTKPDFPKEEIERHRDETLTSFLQARDDPSSLMALVFPSILYPKDHRYSALNIGTESVISKLDRDRLVAFHKQAYRPDGSVLIVVGDVNKATLLPMLEKAFGDWKGSGSSAKTAAIPAVPQVKGRRIVLVDRPGAAQTVIRIARLGVKRQTPDYYALRVLNTVLGGSFTSRLNQNLREEHGYTYGAKSTFEMRREAGPFYAAANVQTDKTGPALAEFFKELDAIGKPLSAEELNKAKNYLAYGYPAGFMSDGDFADWLETLWTYGLDQSFLTGYVDKIQAVSTADVQKAAKTYIVPQDVVIVMVGDRAAIMPQLEGLNLGEVEIVKP